MSGPQKKSDLLNSWKEISAYLDIGIRTCQRYEKRFGLPVHRMDDTGRARIFAYQHEIDAWLSERRNTQLDNEGPRFFRKKFIPGLGALLILVPATAFYLTLRSNSGASDKMSPFSLLATSNTIQLYNNNNQSLWSIDIELHEEVIEFFNKQRSDFRSDETRFYDFADIDADDKNEVLIYLFHQNVEERELVLFDHQKQRIWGKRLDYKQRYRDPSLDYIQFHAEFVRFADVLGSEDPEILIKWENSASRFASAFFIYDLQGEELFHYYHCGHLYDCEIREDSGGKKWILLTGTNNLLGGDGILAVLDCENLRSGTAPPYGLAADLTERAGELDKYIPIDPVPAGQAAYIRFLHNRLNVLYNNYFLSPFFVKTTPGSLTIRIEQAVQDAFLDYRFNPSHQLEMVMPSIGLEQRWRAKYTDGELSFPLSDLWKSMDRFVLYWDQSGWNRQPPASVQ